MDQTADDDFTIQNESQTTCGAVIKKESRTELCPDVGYGAYFTSNILMEILFVPHFQDIS